jgi:putative heme iron utilization protein
MNDISSTELQTEAQRFRDQFKTVLLATSSIEGNPDISYSPYVLDSQGDLYIFISELAQHTQHILANPMVSLMFIEQEGTSRNLYARKRLTLQAKAHEISLDTTDGMSMMEDFLERFGKTIQVLTTLPDFHLFQLKISSGNYIRGFGQAYLVEGSSLEIGHLQQGKTS